MTAEIVRLAHGPQPAGDAEYLTDEDVAERLFGDRAKARKVKDLRLRGEGPRYIRIGKTPITRADWLDAWADKQAVTSTCEERARRR